MGIQMAVSKRVKGCRGRREIKWHVKRERAGAGRQMRSRDRPEGRGAVITANLSRNWVFQLEPGYRPSEDPPCQASVSVWLKSLVPILPIHCQDPGCAVYTACSCHANWICQMEFWGIEKGGVSLRYAKKEFISPSQAVWQACFHPPRFDFVDSLTVQNGLCIGRMAEMTLIVPVCCAPVVPRVVISLHRVHYM